MAHGKNSSCLVTGATGFIGANVVKYLAKNGYNVIGVDIRPPDALMEDYIARLENHVTWLTLDLTDYEKVVDIAKSYKFEGVIHAAIVTAVTKEHEQQHSKQMLSSNLIGTINVLELARMAAVKRFVYVSSSYVYGPTDGPTAISENSDLPYLRMSDFYKITKIAGEKLTQRYSELFPMITTSMRLGSLYGCMERPTGSRFLMNPIFRVLKLLLTDRKKLLRVKGIGDARDWIFALDVAQGLVAGLEAPAVSPLYNLGSGINYAWEQVFRAIQDAGVDFRWEEVGETEDADFDASMVGGKRGPLNMEKANRELGFSPKYAIADGIKEYSRWWASTAKKGIWSP